MQGSDVLLTMAEVGVTVAGFSGLVVAFGRRSGEDIPPIQVFRLLTLAESTAWVLLLALLPFLLHHLSVAPETIWRALGGFMAVGYLFNVALSARRAARLSEDDKRQVSRVSTAFTYAISGLAVIALALAAAGAFPERELGVYLVGLTGILSVAVIMFLRIISAAKMGRRAEEEPAEAGSDEG